jgi:hypothetical protein
MCVRMSLLCVCISCRAVGLSNKLLMPKHGKETLYRVTLTSEALSRATRARGNHPMNARTDIATRIAVMAVSPSHPPVSDPLPVSHHHHLPSSPRGESPLRSELLAKAFAESGPERIPRSARMRFGFDSPTPPGRSSTSDRRSTSAPECLSSSEYSSASASPMLTPATAVASPPVSPLLTPEAAYGLGVLEALVSAGASHPARVSGSRRKGASVWHVTTVHGV